MTLSQRRKIARALALYQSNPDAFSTDDIKGLMQLAQAAGYNFEPNTDIGRLMGNFVFNLADTATFGILPDEWGPEALTSAEKAARMAGDIGGMFIGPGGIAKLATRGAEKLLASTAERTFAEAAAKWLTNPTKFAGTAASIANNEKRLNTLSKLLEYADTKIPWETIRSVPKYSKMFKYGIGGAALGEATDFFEEGPSIPRAVTGGLLGMAGGAFAESRLREGINKAIRTEVPSAYEAVFPESEEAFHKIQRAVAEKLTTAKNSAQAKYIQKGLDRLQELYQSGDEEGFRKLLNKIMNII